MRELSAAIERLYDRVNRETGACDSAEDTLVTIIRNSAPSISRPTHKSSGSPDDPRSGGRDSLLDFARQPFTMSNHRVEILFHSRRGSVCLEPSGLRRHGAIIRGRLLFR